MLRAGLPSNFEFRIIQIHGDDRCAREIRGGNGSQADATATKDRDFVGTCDSSASDGVKAYGQRFDEAQFLERKLRRGEQLLRWHGDEFGQRTVSLHAEGLIEGAGVEPSA